MDRGAQQATVLAKESYVTEHDMKFRGIAGDKSKAWQVCELKAKIRLRMSSCWIMADNSDHHPHDDI